MGGTWWRFGVALAVLVPASWMSRPATGVAEKPRLEHAFILVLQNEDSGGRWLSVISTGRPPPWENSWP